MESRKNSYYLRNFDDFSIGKGNGISNTSGAKTGRSSQSRTMDFNPVEPNPSTPPVRKTPPIDKDTNPVEPNPSTHPVKNIKPVDTDMNPIEPNPSTHPVRNTTHVGTDTNPIEPSPRTPPVRNIEHENRNIDPVGTNQSTSSASDCGYEDSDTNPVDTNQTTSSVSDCEYEDTDTNPVKHDQRDSTPIQDDSEKTDKGTSESVVPIKEDSGSKSSDKTPEVISDTNKNNEIKSAVNVKDDASKINTTKAANENSKPLSPNEKAREILAKLTHTTIGLKNIKNVYKKDILDVYIDDQVKKKEVIFKEVIKERGTNLPMQKDKDGKVIYPNICQYASVIGAINLSGYNYKEGLTKEKVEKILNDAVSRKKCRPYTDVIKEIFGVDAVCYEIPEGISMENFKTLIGDNPALIRFPQRDFWGNDTLPEDGRHGIGYSNGGFIEPYMGRNGEQWKDVRGLKSQAEFKKNLGGFYFKIEN
ncbi:hypothetical protein E4O05_07370 [Treponema sp. OMZ 787]|uniref:hypothetical protein n=1 Tax=Treponema sp. OMZ 787 TaxID=2563669 RepID=UPI0020A4008C|nr:hypothetical protein [Treponema sp. OMZ 787]UTC61382.1 hypothetical protein E4O05_07370 [Treponema sp. OMZ 787]